MRSRQRLLRAILCFISFALIVPTGSLGQSQAGGQRAGEVSRVIPVVSIARGANSLTASEKTVVNWRDQISTQASGRARISLDDGSLLNVGSQSTLLVLKHDSGAQQTLLELGYGKMRTQAQKISKPAGGFEVKTPAGVAGIVGTDFYVSYENDVMTVIVFEGKVRVCNLAGTCVEVGAGQMTMVHKQDTEAPVPTLAMQNVLTDAAATTNTEVNPSLGLVARAIAAHIGNTDVTDGATVYSGDYLTTQAGGTVVVKIGRLSLELQGNSSAHLYRTPYGAVAELDSGSALYATPAGEQKLVIVASDVRITPTAATANLGRVSIEGLCKIIVYNQRGQVSVQTGSETRIVEQSKALSVIPVNSVSYRDYRSPDASDYHNFHVHTACVLPQTTSGGRPPPAGRSRFLYVTVVTITGVSIIPLIKALESPDRP